MHDGGTHAPEKLPVGRAGETEDAAHARVLSWGGWSTGAAALGARRAGQQYHRAGGRAAPGVRAAAHLLPPSRPAGDTRLPSRPCRAAYGLPGPGPAQFPRHRGRADHWRRRSARGGRPRHTSRASRRLGDREERNAHRRAREGVGRRLEGDR